MKLTIYNAEKEKEREREKERKKERERRYIKTTFHSLFGKI